MSSSLSRAGLLVLVLSVLLQETHGADLYVDVSGTDSGSCPSGSPCASIGYAIDTAADGDTVHVVPGVYSGSSHLGNVVNGISLSLRSSGGSSADTAVVAGGNGQFMRLRNGATVTVVGLNLTECGGSSVGYGGAFQVEDSVLDLDDVVIGDAAVVDQAGITASGGAIYADDSTIRLSNCVITGATAGFGGAIYSSDSAITVASTDATANDATISGGFVYSLGGTVNASSCTCTENTAVNGGAFATEAVVTATYSDVNFVDNEGVSGGAVRSLGSSSFTRCVFRGNTAAAGGAIDLDELSTTVIENAEFHSNSAVEGGAVVVEGTGFTATDVVFVSNSAVIGGALNVKSYTGSIALYGSVFANCSVTQSGAAVYSFLQNSDNVGDPILLVDTRMSGNSAQSSGGATLISGKAALTVVGGEFVHNVGELGGVIAMDDTAVIRLTRVSCTDNEAIAGAVVWMSKTTQLVVDTGELSNNFASTYGAAIFSFSQGTVDVSNVSVSGNVALYGGGGIFADLSTALTISDSNLTLNSVPEGEGGAILCRQNVKFTGAGLHVSDNSALSGAGTYAADNVRMRVSTSTYTRNTAVNSGGSITLEGLAIGSVNSSVFYEAYALDGAAISVAGQAVLHVDGSRLYDHTIEGTGGAVLCSGAEAAVSFSNTTMASNSASAGGALYSTACALEFFNSSFDANEATTNGGALNVPYSTNIYGSVLTGNSAEFGGAVYVSSSGDDAQRNATGFTNSDFGGNLAKGAGGAVFYNDYRPSADPWCLHCTFGGNNTNTALGYGQDVATLPSTLVYNQGPEKGAPGDLDELRVSANERFDFAVEVFDYFEESVRFAEGEVEIPMQVEVTPVGSEIVGPTIVNVVDGVAFFSNLLLRSAKPSKDWEDKNKYVEYNGVNYLLDFGYPLVFESLPASEKFVAYVELGRCDPGWEKDVNKKDNYFFCTECKAGYFQLDGFSDCQICPVGAVCEGGTRILSQADYWRYPPEDEEDIDRLTNPVFYRCPRHQCCIKGSCTIEDTCPFLHRTGTLCGDCEEGYYEWGRSCLKCDRFDLPLLAIPFVVGLLFTIYVYRSGALIRGDFIIMIYYLQTVPYIIGPNSPASAPFEAFVWKLDYLALQGRCPIQLTDFQKTLMQFSLPTLAILQFIAVAVVGRIMGFKWPERTNLAKVTNHEFYALMHLLSFMYSAYTEMVFQLLICRRVEDTLVVKSSPMVECYGDTHLTYLFSPIIAALGFLLPVPLVFAYIRWRSMRDYEATLTDTNAADIKHLWVDFRHNRYWWAAVILLRRVLVIALYVTFYEDPERKSLTILFACLFIGVLQFGAMPYISLFDNFVANMSLFLLSIAAYLEHYGERYSFPPPAHEPMRIAIPYVGMGMVVLYWWLNILRRLALHIWPDWALLRDANELIEDFLTGTDSQTDSDVTVLRSEHSQDKFAYQDTTTYSNMTG